MHIPFGVAVDFTLFCLTVNFEGHCWLLQTIWI